MPVLQLGRPGPVAALELRYGALPAAPVDEAGRQPRGASTHLEQGRSPANLSALPALSALSTDRRPSTQVDLEGVGLLDAERVGEVLEQLGVVVSPAQLEKMVAEYGVDGSGLVQVEDF